MVRLHSLRKSGSRNGSRQGTTSQLAEKLASDDVLKGHSFSCAAQALYFCHPERALAREGSAFLTFSAAYSVVPPSLRSCSAERTSVREAPQPSKHHLLQRGADYQWRLRGALDVFYAQARSYLVQHQSGLGHSDVGHLRRNVVHHPQAGDR